MSGGPIFPIGGDGMSAEVLDIAASLRRVMLDGVDRLRVLGLADRPTHWLRLGALAGRF